MEARITSIAAGVTVQARAAADGPVPAGAWREIEEGGEVAHREELLVEADGPKYDFAACLVQKRTAGAWADGLTVTLDVGEGSSHFVTKRLSVAGDATNSAVAAITIDQGEADLKAALNALQRSARTGFTVEGSVTRWRGVLSEVEHGNRAGLGGFQQEFLGIMMADREQFESAGFTPERGRTITVHGVSYRITTVKVDDIAYAIEFESVNR